MMVDYIDRQAAIDAICRDGVRLERGGALIITISTAKQWAVDLLSKLPSAQPKAIRPKFVAEDRYLKNHFQTFPHCPKCNYELETGDCYCRVCGCHIDWSEDDE